ncbi:MAG: hypothetical protein GY715_16540 [Planctomycetes bacterium]|nr:hypothetical protein [Planctomycetota bacterium]
MDVETVVAGRRRSRAPWLVVCAAVPAFIALPLLFASDPDAGPRTRPHAVRRTAPAAPALLDGSPRNGPSIIQEPEHRRLRILTEDGPVFINQLGDGTPGDGPTQGCLACHSHLEDATRNMFGGGLDCTFCHGGDPDLTTIEAHVESNGDVVYDKTVPPLDQDLAYQRFVNPSNLRVVNQTCGLCHPDALETIFKSMMATAAGHYAGGLYQNNVVDTKTPVYGTFAVSDDDGTVPYEKGAVQSLLDLIVFNGGDPSLFSTHFAAVPSQACARCHLWSRGKGYRGAVGAEGTYRADGCAACHMLYDNDGLSLSDDASINHAQPGHPIQHIVTREITTEQCVHCHHRGARIGLNFTGRAQMPPRLPSGLGVPGTTDVRFNGNYHYAVNDTNPQDLHGERGLACIDCHVKTEIMGDGNIYGHMDQATKIECRTCHGTPDTLPTLLDNDQQDLPNVIMDPQGDYWLTSKVTGAQHAVPPAMDVVASNPYAACAMNANHIKAEGGLECYACHSSWVPNCFGCHFERDEQFPGLNLMTRRLEIGRARTNNKVFESLRYFTIGPNSEGRVAPYVVACQPIADVTSRTGEKLLDLVMPETSNGRSGLAHNPVNPHTVRGAGEVRSCAECHRSPPTLGMGSGNYAVARDRVYTAGASGVNQYDRDENPEQPVLGAALPVTGTVHAIEALPNVVHGTADFLYVARGPEGVDIFDRSARGTRGSPQTASTRSPRTIPQIAAADDPVWTIEGVNAIDVSRSGNHLYVVDAGIGVQIYDNEDPGVATYVATVHSAGAVRAVPWGIHLLVAAGDEGLLVVDIADHSAPFVAGFVPGIHAVDVRPYAHFQGGSDFAVRAYVADPAYGVRVVDLLPDYESPQLLGGLSLPGAVSLDTYARYVVASGVEPSREHDYLYVVAGAAGLHVFDITDPDQVTAVAAVALGGIASDVDVASELVPPGTDDHALVANETLGLQVVDVNDPTNPVLLDPVPDSPGTSRVLVEVQQLDRFLDEEGSQLKENSHPFTGIFSRADIVRVLSAPIGCDIPSPDFDGDGDVDFTDLLILIGQWGDCPSPPAECPTDLNGDGSVDFADVLLVLAAWG